MDRVLQAYQEIPVVTRTFATLVLLVTLGCQFQHLNPYELYFNFELVFKKFEIWRIVTNFLYFGPFGVDFIFHLFFIVRYCRMLEESSFRNRTADFLCLILFGMASLLVVSSVLHLNFMGSALSFMIVYIWAKRNPFIHMNMFGVFNFTAPYLPWVLLLFSLVVSGSAPINDILGIILGHIYFFLQDVYPVAFKAAPFLKTPYFLRFICNELNVGSQPAAAQSNSDDQQENFDQAEPQEEETPD